MIAANRLAVCDIPLFCQFKPSLDKQQYFWITTTSKTRSDCLSPTVFFDHVNIWFQLLCWVMFSLDSTCYYDLMQGGPVELSRDDWEALRVRGVKVGSTSDEGGNNLYQPITTLDRSSSSRRIWATPMKHLWSMRP